jgi:hypothetical protein
LSNSCISPTFIDASRSLANVLNNRSPSKHPLFLVWYTSRALNVSSSSPFRSSGLGMSQFSGLSDNRSGTYFSLATVEGSRASGQGSALREADEERHLMATVGLVSGL